MAKFKLQPDPTFKAKVKIPVAGEAKAAEVEFTFKYRGRDELTALLERNKVQDRVTTIMEMAVGWELSDAFNEENMKVLDGAYIGALDRIADTYWEEHTKALEKN